LKTIAILKIKEIKFNHYKRSKKFNIFSKEKATFLSNTLLALLNVLVIIQIFVIEKVIKKKRKQKEME